MPCNHQYFISSHLTIGFLLVYTVHSLQTRPTLLLHVAKNNRELISGLKPNQRFVIPIHPSISPSCSRENDDINFPPNEYWWRHDILGIHRCYKITVGLHAWAAWLRERCWCVYVIVYRMCFSLLFIYLYIFFPFAMNQYGNCLLCDTIMEFSTFTITWIYRLLSMAIFSQIVKRDRVLLVSCI